MAVKVGVVVFPGSNCDRDTYHVLTDVLGLDAQYCWHEKPLPEGMDAVILPGGFSYGDRLRAGAIAAHSPIISDVRKAADRGVPILGVCNGFQILVEAGLLPGALLMNNSLDFMCRWTSLVVHNNKTPFTNKLDTSQRIPIPVANGQGRYYADDDTLQRLKKNNQIVFRYTQDDSNSYNHLKHQHNGMDVPDHDTSATPSKYPPFRSMPTHIMNGSTDNIAGVCNEQGNIVGMMPHPERAAEPEINPTSHVPSLLIFQSMIASASGGAAEEEVHTH